METRMTSVFVVNRQMRSKREIIPRESFIIPACKTLEGMVCLQEIMQLVTEISGRRNKGCYYVLCWAIEVVRERQPDGMQMKEVCAVINKDAGMTPGAAAKALSRAVDDIWDNGNREKLCQIYGRPLLERPSPKELINVLAQHLWKE